MTNQVHPGILRIETGAAISGQLTVKFILAKRQPSPGWVAVVLFFDPNRHNKVSDVKRDRHRHLIHPKPAIGRLRAGAAGGGLTPPFGGRSQPPTILCSTPFYSRPVPGAEIILPCIAKPVK